MAVTSNSLILPSDLTALAALANGKSTLAGVPYSFPDLPLTTNKFTGGLGLVATALTGVGTGLHVNVYVANGQVYSISITTSSSGFVVGDTITFTDATGTGFIGTVIRAASGNAQTIAINTPPNWMSEFNRLSQNLEVLLQTNSLNVAGHVFTDAATKWPISSCADINNVYISGLVNSISGIYADDIDFYYADTGGTVTVSSTWNLSTGGTGSESIPLASESPPTNPADFTWITHIDISGGMTFPIFGNLDSSNTALTCGSFLGTFVSGTTTIPGASVVGGSNSPGTGFANLVIPPTVIPDGSYMFSATFLGVTNSFSPLIVSHIPNSPVAVPALHSSKTVYKISKCSAGIPLKINRSGFASPRFNTNPTSLLTVNATTSGMFVGRCLQYDSNGYSALKAIGNDRGDLMSWHNLNYAWKPNSWYSFNEYTNSRANLGQIIIDVNGNYQMATTSGYTGSSQPIWSTAANSTTNDGSVVWTTIGLSPLQPNLVSAPRWPYFNSANPSVVIPGSCPTVTATWIPGAGLNVPVVGWFIFSISLHREILNPPNEVSVDVGCIRNGNYVSFGTFMTGATANPVMWPIFSNIPLCYVCSENIEIHASVCNMESQTSSHYTGLPGWRKESYAYPIRADAYNWIESALNQIT